MKMSPEIITFIKKECVGLRVNKKNMVHLKYLILKAPYIISLYSVGILVLRKLNTLPTIYQILTTTAFPFFA